MQIQPKTPAFEDFSGALMEADAMTNPAEIHGILAGLICTGQRLDGKFWFDAVLKLLATRANFSTAQRNLIIELYDTVCRQLNGHEDEFYLLLPSAERPLIDRATALSYWCEGFLYGLGLGGANPAIDHASLEAREALRCMTELAKLDLERVDVSEKNSEMDQFAYQGVIEYVRIAVMTMYTEFAKKPQLLH
jgi:yecA family protein